MHYEAKLLANLPRAFLSKSRLVKVKGAVMMPQAFWRLHTRHVEYQLMPGVEMRAALILSHVRLVPVDFVLLRRSYAGHIALSACITRSFLHPGASDLTASVAPCSFMCLTICPTLMYCLCDLDT